MGKSIYKNIKEMESDLRACQIIDSKMKLWKSIYQNSPKHVKVKMVKQKLVELGFTESEIKSMML